MEILLIIEADNATTQLIERVLKVCVPGGLRYRKVYLPGLRFEDFAPTTLPMLVRCGDPGLPVWIEFLRRARRPYVYYLDDNFWELQGDSPVARYYRRSDVRSTLRLAVSGAHTVIVNTPVLGDYLKRFNPAVHETPAFFDFSLIDGVAREQTSEIRIGFAGSPSREDDIEILKPVVDATLARWPNAVFEFVGVITRGLTPGPRIRYFPHVNSYEEYLRFQVGRNWTIGLAPLQDYPANRAKTNNKFREYGACGIAGIYSHIPPYLGSVEDGVTGLLVGSEPVEWVSAINRLLMNEHLRRSIAQAAEAAVRRRHDVQVVARDWHACLVGAYSAPHGGRVRFRWVYLTGTSQRRLLAAVRQLALEVADAYEKGGVQLVIRKTFERVRRELRGVLKRPVSM